MTRTRGGGWRTLAAGVSLGLVGIGLDGCGPATPADSPTAGSKITGQPPAAGVTNPTKAEGGGAGKDGAFTAGPKTPQPGELPAGYPKPGKDQAGGEGGGAATATPKAGDASDAGTKPSAEPGSTAPASDPGNAAPKSSGDAAVPGGSAKGTDSGAPGSASPSPPASGGSAPSGSATPKR